MRRILWVFVGLFGFAALAEAQDATASSSIQKLNNKTGWDVAATAGLLSSNPAPSEHPYADEWYFAGRYAVSIGRYWSPHLKTEIELVNATEGERYIERVANLPGVPHSYVYTAREHHTLRQVSGRTVWQFFENAWAHPYVFAGLVYDADRVETFVPSQWLYQPRTPDAPLIPSPPQAPDAVTVHRLGATAGLGAKLYASPRVFVTTAVVVSYARPSTTTSIIGGFGVDF